MSDCVVVDASLAAKWVFDETHSAQAIALLQEWIDGETRILAPPLLTAEIANIAYKRVGRGLITMEQAKVALTGVLRADITYDHDPMLSLLALEFAHHLALTATYDAHYLALAQRENCACWTADERLWNTVKVQVPWVHWIGNYHAEMETEI